MKVEFLPQNVKSWYLGLIRPVVDFFIRLELNPNFFTTIGFVLSIIAAYMFATGSLRFAGLIVLLAGTFDIVDGQVARATNRVTKFGALYDSTLDRYSEVIIFFGMAYFFVNESMLKTSVAVSIALGGSVMVSYVRARAEALGFECKVGMMQRPERVVYIGLGALIHQVVLILALTIVAVLANFTALQRLYYIWQQENTPEKLELKKQQSATPETGTTDAA
ncbi:MAG: CDP-alcohol phosphatidyltransferase family protein [Deferribacteres bacterium]|nr:CDP-alcohol phosphatidyltransferase family protein [candidate division KSB1 bacterium]MCB9509652.1 CDP-alcohol phosphatidyltransferase family protein [Deferribacteres bacterium]